MQVNKELVESLVVRAVASLSKLGYTGVSVDCDEFITWMTAETFAPDLTTVHDVLASNSLMVHEVVEINEAKKLGLDVNHRVFMEAPREIIYDAHLTAYEYELKYLRAVYLDRVRNLVNVSETDEFMPDEVKPRVASLIQRAQSNEL